MPSNINNPFEWKEIINFIRNGDDAAAIERLTQRERRLDAHISTFSSDQFVPILYQNAILVTTSTTVIEGFRIGSFVWYSGRLVATGAGTANGYVAVSIPPFLPYSPPTNVQVHGNMQIYDQSVNIWYAGNVVFHPTIGQNLAALPAANSASLLGQAGSPFTAAFANLDQVTWSCWYQTSAPQ
jgi:hypothetical protein